MKFHHAALVVFNIGNPWLHGGQPTTATASVR